MKVNILYILLSLSTAVFAQKNIPNLTSISLHKIYNEVDDGSCNSFKDKQSAQVLSREITDCDNLVMELIRLKADLKNRKSTECSCQQGFIGGDSIEYMITYQFNKLVDTIYFNNNQYEKKIIDYNNKKEYQDSNNGILKIINQDKTLKELFKTDIDKIFYETFILSKNDSIDIENLNINGKKIYGLNRKEVDLLVGGFSELESDISLDKLRTDFHKYHKPYQNSNNYYYFSDDYPINRIVIQKSGKKGNEYLDYELFDLRGIQLDITEKELVQRFPASTKELENQKKYFKENNGDYSVALNIKDNKGHIYFVLNNSEIIKIDIMFRYPKN
jgi:hypothetical protein